MELYKKVTDKSGNTFLESASQIDVGCWLGDYDCHIVTREWLRTVEQMGRGALNIIAQVDGALPQRGPHGTPGFEL